MFVQNKRKKNEIKFLDEKELINISNTFNLCP